MFAGRAQRLLVAQVAGQGSQGTRGKTAVVVRSLLHVLDLYECRLSPLRCICRHAVYMLNAVSGHDPCF